MKTSLVIIGSGSHANSIYYEVKKRYQEVVVIDEFFPHGKILNAVGGLEVLNQYLITSEFVVLIGDNVIRESYFNTLKKSKVNFATILNSYSLISDNVVIGQGSQILIGAIINRGANIGENVIINSGAIIEHDCMIGSHSHIGPGAVLTGSVSVGERVLIGAGSVVNPNLIICDDVIIGSGSVVTCNIETPGIYVGTPSRKIK
jgi:UDP-N-acetylbacillosamine N-acetyltransferase